MSDVQRKNWFLFVTCDKRYSASHEVLRDGRMLAVQAESLVQALAQAKNVALVQGRKLVIKSELYENLRGFHPDKDSPEPFHTEVEVGCSGPAFGDASFKLGMQIARAKYSVEASISVELCGDDGCD